ncbi:MAG: TetR/AcrR family transcriptional regulator [Phycisphaerae bacterium]|nr:TetR/AcrR family transcriptional regulator [Phycisphaerae bacterium]
MTRGATNTKSRILQTARTLYSTHGCDTTTLEDIITAAGITKGAFYHYFKSKESLCEAVMDQVIEDYRHLAANLDTSAEPIEQLKQMVMNLARLNASGEWVNCRLILRLSADCHGSHPQVQRRLREFWRWETGFFEELIERCTAAGQLSKRMDVQTQTRLLLAVMAGAIMLDRMEPSESVFAARLCERVIDVLCAS